MEGYTFLTLDPLLRHPFSFSTILSLDMAPPSFNFRSECEHCTQMFVKVPMDRESFVFFPELHRPNFAAQVVSDLFP
jgi:hypothetical protein